MKNILILFAVLCFSTSLSFGQQGGGTNSDYISTSPQTTTSTSTTTTNAATATSTTYSPAILKEFYDRAYPIGYHDGLSRKVSGDINAAPDWQMTTMPPMTNPAIAAKWKEGYTKGFYDGMAGTITEDFAGNSAGTEPPAVLIPDYYAGLVAGCQAAQRKATFNDTPPTNPKISDNETYKLAYKEGYNYVANQPGSGISPVDTSTSTTTTTTATTSTPSNPIVPFSAIHTTITDPASYNAGYEAGKAVGSQNKTFDNKVPSGIADAAQYQAGYLEGYCHGYNSIYLNQKQTKASDAKAYQLGYIAAWQNTGYQNTPPATRTTDDTKKKYTESYHMGYFDALADKILLQTGKYKTETNGKGTQILRLDSGTMIIKDTDGMTYVKNGNVQITLKSDGTSTSTLLISDDGKGNTVWQESNGAKLYQYGDGSWYYAGINNYWAYYDASASTRINSDNSWEYWNYTTGYYCYTDSKGVTTWYKNGAVTTPPTSS